VLYRFQGGSDGFFPVAGLIADSEGALYGTTGGGGSNNDTVFKLTPAHDKATGKTTWTENVLYRFQGGSDGYFPLAGLIADSEGALYGTTQNGGSGDNGTVFKLTPPAKGRSPLTQTAWTETVLYRFQSGSDGSLPAAGLIADREGALYGTTQFGGSGCQHLPPGSSGCGTFFKLTPARKQTAWTESVLYRFQGGGDGSYPYAGLIADSEGALYGTTAFSGSLGNGAGTVFKLTPARNQTAWTESVLYIFQGGSDGSLPLARLIADKEGALYGTTVNGGTAGRGTVFKLDLCPKSKGQCPVFVSEE
jgi:uncharacterized repeat protein (TIGR03803 family)